MIVRMLAAYLILSVLAYSPMVLAEGEKQKDEKVKVSAKEMAEIKRQIRLMRAEMAELEEKIEQITGLHDNVYTTEKPSEESASGQSKSKE